MNFLTSNHIMKRLVVALISVVSTLGSVAIVSADSPLGFPSSTIGGSSVLSAGTGSSANAPSSYVSKRSAGIVGIERQKAIRSAIYPPQVKVASTSKDVDTAKKVSARAAMASSPKATTLSALTSSTVSAVAQTIDMTLPTYLTYLDKAGATGTAGTGFLSTNSVYSSYLNKSLYTTTTFLNEGLYTGVLDDDYALSAYVATHNTTLSSSINSLTTKTINGGNNLALPSNIDPVWSATEDFVVFASNRTSVSNPTPTSYYHLYLLKLGGYSSSDATTFVQLTGLTTSDSTTSQRWPALNSNASLIYYCDGSAGAYRLTYATMSVNSSNIYTLSANTHVFSSGDDDFDVEHPSTVGSLTVFAARTFGTTGPYHIWYANDPTKSTVVTQLTQDPAGNGTDEENPVLGSNGGIVAFDSTASGFTAATGSSGNTLGYLKSSGKNASSRNIFIANLGGTVASALTTSTAYNNITPCWSLNATNPYFNSSNASPRQYIFFSSNRPTVNSSGAPSANYQIYYLRADMSSTTKPWSKANPPTISSSGNQLLDAEGEDHNDTIYSGPNLAVEVDTSDPNHSYNHYSPTISTLASYVSVVYSSERYTTALDNDNPVNNTIQVSATGGASTVSTTASNPTATPNYYIDNQPENQPTVSTSLNADIEAYPSPSGTATWKNREICLSQLLDMDAPSIMTYNSNSSEICGIESQLTQGQPTKYVQAGTPVTIVARFSDKQSALRSAYIQLKDPNSIYQGSDALEHKVFGHGVEDDFHRLINPLKFTVSACLNGSFTASSSTTSAVLPVTNTSGFNLGDYVTIYDETTPPTPTGANTMTSAVNSTYSEGQITAIGSGTITVSGFTQSHAYAAGDLLVDVTVGVEDDEATSFEYLYGEIGIGGYDSTYTHLYLSNAFDTVPKGQIRGLVTGAGSKGANTFSSTYELYEGDTIGLTGACDLTTFVEHAVVDPATGIWTITISDPLPNDWTGTQVVVITRLVARLFDMFGAEIDCQALDASKAGSTAGDVDFSKTFDGSSPLDYVIPKWLPGADDENPWSGCYDYKRYYGTTTYSNTLYVNTVSATNLNAPAGGDVTLPLSAAKTAFPVGSYVVVSDGVHSARGYVYASTTTSVSLYGFNSDYFTTAASLQSCTVSSIGWSDSRVQNAWIQMSPLATTINNPTQIVSVTDPTNSSANVTGLSIPVSSITGFSLGDTVKLVGSGGSDIATIIATPHFSTSTQQGTIIVLSSQVSGSYASGDSVYEVQSVGGGVLYSATFTTSSTVASDFYIDLAVSDNAKFPTPYDSTGGYVLNYNSVSDSTSSTHGVSFTDGFNYNWRIYDNVEGFTTQAFTPTQGILVVNDHSLPQKFLAGSNTLEPAKNYGSESYITDLDVDFEQPVYTNLQSTYPASIYSRPPASLPRYIVAYSSANGYYAQPLMDSENSLADATGVGSDFNNIIDANKYGFGYTNALGVNSYYDGDNSGASIQYSRTLYNDVSPVTLGVAASTSIPNGAWTLNFWNTDSQKYDLWRVLSRGAIDGVTLNKYAPTLVSEPSPDETSSTTQTVVDGDKCVIWDSPFTGDEFVGSETLASSSIQTLLLNYMEAGGRLYAAGQDIGESLTSGGSATSGDGYNLYTTYLNATFVSDEEYAIYDLLVTSSTDLDFLTHDPYTNWISATGTQSSYSHDYFELHNGSLNYTPVSSLTNYICSSFTNDGADPQYVHTDGSLDTNISPNPENMDEFTLTSKTNSLSEFQLAEFPNTQLIYTGSPTGNILATGKTASSAFMSIYGSFGIGNLTQTLNTTTATLSGWKTMYASFNARAKLMHNAVCLLRDGYIKGTVTSSGTASGGIAGALVTATLYPEGSSTQYYTALTDSNGTYKILGVPPGCYLVQASAQIGQTSTYDHSSNSFVNVHGGDFGTLPLNIGLSSNPSLTVYVYDATTKAAVSGATVSISDGAHSYSAMTGATGYASFPSIVAGTYGAGTYNGVAYTSTVTDSSYYTQYEITGWSLTAGSYAESVALSPSPGTFKLGVYTSSTPTTLFGATTVAYTLKTAAGVVVTDTSGNSITSTGRNFLTSGVFGPATITPGTYYLYASASAYSLTDIASSTVLTSSNPLLVAISAGGTSTVQLYATTNAGTVDVIVKHGGNTVSDGSAVVCVGTASAPWVSGDGYYEATGQSKNTSLYCTATYTVGGVTYTGKNTITLSSNSGVVTINADTSSAFVTETLVYSGTSTLVTGLSATATLSDSANNYYYPATTTTSDSNGDFYFYVPQSTSAVTYNATVTPTSSTTFGTGTGTVTVAANAVTGAGTVQMPVAPVTISGTVQTAGSSGYTGVSGATVSVYGPAKTTVLATGTTASDGTYSISVPVTTTTSIAYYVSATASGYVSSSFVSAGTSGPGGTLTATITLIASVHTFASTSGAYMMYSEPYDFTNSPSVANLLDGWGGFGKTNGPRIAVYDPASTNAVNYYVYDSSGDYPADTLHRGIGFWMRPGLDAIVSNSPSGSVSLIAYTAEETQDTTEPYTIKLSAGWNMIGDPWKSTTAVPIADFVVSNGGTVSVSWNQATSDAIHYVYPTLYTWNGSSYVAYTSSSTTNNSLSQYVGYWVYAYVDCYLSITSPSS